MIDLQLRREVTRLVHVPPPPLSRFVEYLWLHEAPAPEHSWEHVIPTGTTEIVVTLAAAPLRVARGERRGAITLGTAMVCGAHASPFAVDTRPQARLLGVHFKPGGAFPFFTVPATELRDACVPLDELWRAAPTLLDRLAAARTATACFAVLEEALVAHVVRPLAHHPAVACALARLDHATPATVAAVVRETGLSPRRLIEVFEREVGLTPKLFARVRRLQAVLERLDDPVGSRWVELAIDHGFFDQAHMIRDFHDFTGLAPSVYVARRAPSLNHLVVPDDG